MNGIFIFLMQNVKPLEKATLTYLVRRKGAEAWLGHVSIISSSKKQLVEKSFDLRVLGMEWSDCSWFQHFLPFVFLCFVHKKLFCHHVQPQCIKIIPPGISDKQKSNNKTIFREWVKYKNSKSLKLIKTINNEWTFMFRVGSDFKSGPHLIMFFFPKSGNAKPKS